ncbi:hypothetical protein AVEN_157257-1 [Araneus ventricosus]|uniref:Uncharacterized protein n=1 Tax=Araneus ventricosus TaxID=182803 RepID=A0A4Y2VPU2_ARAVE|nr:hypothetical protein AVEN_32199-1 [Araneus ventricosus]GBO25757.1 hypothetical protein AVEN_157257-1 [Araneus ventricosus]
MVGAENGEKPFCQQNSFKPDIFYSVIKPTGSCAKSRKASVPENKQLKRSKNNGFSFFVGMSPAFSNTSDLLFCPVNPDTSAETYSNPTCDQFQRIRPSEKSL